MTLKNPFNSRIKFKYGFSRTMEQALEYREKGLHHIEISRLVDLHKAQLSKGIRIYLTSLGKTPDSANIDVRNRAIELVKQLDEEEISLHYADDELRDFSRSLLGKTTARTAAVFNNPELQAASYSKAVAALEGICFAIDKFPGTVHPAITLEMRRDYEVRLAKCRRIIEQRINILRKDSNVND